MMRLEKVRVSTLKMMEMHWPGTICIVQSESYRLSPNGVEKSHWGGLCFFERGTDLRRLSRRGSVGRSLPVWVQRYA